MGMNDKAGNALLQTYFELLGKRGESPEKCDDASYQARNRRHVMWMCREAQTITDPEKKQRWLGFIQGCLWMEALRTVEELKGEVILAQDASR